MKYNKWIRKINRLFIPRPTKEVNKRFDMAERTISFPEEYFNRFFNILKNKKNTDSIHTASMMSVMSIIMGIKLLKKNIKKIIVTGGGRKNNFLMKSIGNKLIKIKIMKIDQFGYNGDLLEAQMFAYLAVRSLKKLPLSTPNTTGVNKSITGGYLYS